MKRFEQGGKLLGIALVALALLFAGCSQPSSEEGSAASPSGSSAVTIPMEMKDGNLIIGDGAGLGVAKLNGHTVEIRNGDTGCFAAGDVANCWVRVINRDAAVYMANVKVKLNGCTTCLTASMDNADALNGNTTHPIIPVPPYTLGGDFGASTGVNVFNGTEFMLVEDGDYRFSAMPFNKFGAPLHTNPSGSVKPFQTLHPTCGARSILWDFGGQTVNYRFYASLTAQYFNATPWGPDQIPGNGDDTDAARYDAVNSSTYYVQITDLADKFGAANPRRAWYRIGSNVRSNVLSGYGAILPGRAILANNRYFGVNVSAEYPNRMEGQIVGTSVGFTNYEWYSQFAYLLRYDPKTVRRVTANGKTGGAVGTAITAGTQTTCMAANCTNGLLETFRENDVPASGYGWGYISTSEGVPTASNFTWVGTGQYLTLLGGIANVNATGIAPQYFGHKGRAQIRHNVGGPAVTITSAATAVTQDGVDAAPELTLAMYFFQVKLKGSGNIVGRGSEFSIDQFSGFTSYSLGYTNGTLWPESGFSTSGGSDDWLGYCWPFTAGHTGNLEMGCDPVASMFDYKIYSGNESSNVLILQSGESTPLYGAYQAWNAYICVQ